ncbi:hypothetical protein N9Q05_00220 [bacterium]|nr:hypothetical protein [bacterium]
MDFNRSATLIFDDNDCVDLAGNSEKKSNDPQEGSFQPNITPAIENQPINDPKITLENKITHSLFNPKRENAKKILWENNNQKKCIAYDLSGQAHDVRCVNQNKQWAIWSQEKNSQVYVHRSNKNGIVVFASPLGELSNQKPTTLNSKM